MTIGWGHEGPLPQPRVATIAESPKTRTCRHSAAKRHSGRLQQINPGSPASPLPEKGGAEREARTRSDDWLCGFLAKDVLRAGVTGAAWPAVPAAAAVRRDPRGKAAG